MALYKRDEIWYVRGQINGVKINKTTKTKNKRIAEGLEKQWLGQLHQEAVVKGRKPVTVKKAIEHYLNARRGTAGYESAEVKMRVFKPFESQLLHEVDGSAVSEEMRKLVDTGYSVNTINVSIIYWNALQNHCTKVGFTPGHKIKRLKGGSNRVRFLTDQEVRLLLAELDPQRQDALGNDAYREKRKAQDNYDFTVLLMHTGAREQEIASLALSQIDTNSNTITIHRTKGGTDTTMPMTPDVVNIIARRMVAAEQPLPEGKSLHGRTGNGYLIPERAKGRYNNEYLAKAAQRAGLKDVTLHTLRHTAACKWLRSGLQLTEVQYLLGHKNLTSTMVYAHIIPQAAGLKAAEVWETA